MHNLGTVRQIPLVRIVIPYIAGIVICIHISIPLILPASAIIILFIEYIGIGFIYEFQYQYRLRFVFSFIVYGIFFLLGIVITENHNIPGQVLKSQDEEIYLARIDEPLTEKEKTFKTILLLSKRSDLYKQRVRVIGYIHKDTVSKRLQYGDIIIFKSKMNRINNSGNPHAFDIQKYNNRKGIYYSTFIRSENWEKVNALKKFSLKSTALNINQYLRNIYKRSGLEGEELAVISALTLGYKEDLSEEIKDSFAGAGGIHVLAISGLHVGIIYFVLHLLFGFLKRNKPGKFLYVLIIICFLWSFAIITGLSSSVVRASIMFSIIVTGNIFGRKTNIYNIIAAAAFIILIFNPYQITDLGFQLSFLAVLSIIFFQPVLYKWIVFKNYLPDKIWMLITVSVSAQIGTFPLTVFYFNTFPVYFWLTNILLIPLVTLVIYLAFALLIIMIFIPEFSFISVILKVVLDLKIAWVKFVSDLPCSHLDHIYCDLTMCILLYVLIVTLSLFIIYQNRRFIYIIVLIIVILILSDLRRSWNIRRQKEFVVYNISGKLAVDLTSGNNNVFITNIEETTNSRDFEYSVKNNWIVKGICNHSEIIRYDHIYDKYPLISGYTYVDTLFGNRIIHFNKKRILILENMKYRYYTTDHRLLIDYIIVNEKMYPDLDKLSGLFDIRCFILNNTFSDWYKEQWIEKLKERKCNYYSVRDKGAFIEKFP